MSDLSWLNPTPHAIAVYASQPLSPVATQHSLPSGRYSLTWAGLPPAGSHQLAAGALIRSPRRRGQQRGRHIEADRLGCRVIDNKFELGCPQDWQVSRLSALEDAS